MVRAILCAVALGLWLGLSFADQALLHGRRHQSPSAVKKATATLRHLQPALQGNGKKKSGGIRFSGSSR